MARAPRGSPRVARLQTDRLVLRPFEPGDLDPMAEALGDPASMRFYPHPFSRDETRTWLERNRARFERDGLGLWAITLRDTGEVVGDSPG